jgi:cellulose synthase/poly-beta-1,6-N-acetylglucosamine synthase-like glycosyltransferase
MASQVSLRARYQDLVNLVCAVLLFVSPWILRFSGDDMAARAAWITGVVVAIFAVAALVRFAEWEEWISLLLGVWMIIAPWVVNFSTISHAVAAFVILGIVVALASVSEIWQIRHPHAMAH